MAESSTFITFRRSRLDDLLVAHQHLMHGRVLDIGGKKKNKRGAFQPPKDGVEAWHYVNIDPATTPDYLCSADAMTPVKDGAYDLALLCEVLEHVEDPVGVLREARRVLREGGALLVSVPFLVPVHGDPSDYQRWTHFKLHQELEALGFSNINIQPMGGPGAVVHDTLRAAITNSRRRTAMRLGLGLLRVFRLLFRLMDASAGGNGAITTGYFVTATK